MALREEVGKILEPPDPRNAVSVRLRIGLGVEVGVLPDKRAIEPWACKDA